MTIFVAANMSGCDKLPLVIIVKSQNPRQIRTVKHLPFDYYFNTTAWMTEVIFYGYCQKLNVQMMKKKRSILLFIDNCKAHPVNIYFRTTISNSFRHCGFYRAKCSTKHELTDESYDEFANIKPMFHNIVPKEETVDFEAYVNADNNLSVSEPINEYISTSESDELIESSIDINGHTINENSNDMPIHVVTQNILSCRKLLNYIRYNGKMSSMHVKC